MVMMRLSDEYKFFTFEMRKRCYSEETWIVGAVIGHVSDKAATDDI
jgi:hypothetical protein